MIRLGRAAQSAIETDVIDGADDEHDPTSFTVLRAHLARGGTAIREPASRTDAMAVLDALIELSNGYDAQAEERGTDAETRRFARQACAQIGTAADRVIEPWRNP